MLVPVRILAMVWCNSIVFFLDWLQFPASIKTLKKQRQTLRPSQKMLLLLNQLRFTLHLTHYLMLQ